MLARAIPDRFGAAYGPGGALKLTAGMNFSVGKVRPVPCNTASPEEIDAYVGNTIGAIRRHAGLDYSIICLDAAGLADSPSSASGIRPRGGRDTVGVNFSTKTTRIMFLMERVPVLRVWNQATPATALGPVLQALIGLVRRGHLPSAVAHMPYVIGVLVQVAVGV